jgi:hypothetical protein
VRRSGASPHGPGIGTLRPMLGHRSTHRLAAVAAVAAVSISASGALAAGRATPARGATRSAIVHAFVRQDGTSQGIVGVYLSGSEGIVCQHTPDAGLLRFLFRHSGSSWRYAFSTRGTTKGTATERTLERACH